MDLPSPPQSPALASPGLPASPNTSRFQSFFRNRPRSSTAGAGNGLPSPSGALSDSEQGRASYFRVRIGRSGSINGRERSASVTSPGLNGPSEPNSPAAVNASNPMEALSTAASANTSHSIRLVPHLELSARSLHFEPITKSVPSGAVLKIGRFNDRVTQTREDQYRITFKSKVVSRTHAEVSVDASGRFWVRDTKSSSGTFLNHIRLSGPGLDSRLYPISDGDILQLGVDYQGGTEEMYRCVKIKVELNRSAPKPSQHFNAKAMKQLKALGVAGPSSKTHKASAPASSESTDCCICLFAVTVCQSLFIAPCSHVYHYKCIRPLLQMHHPGFSCPLCRTFADLEADVEQDEEDFEDREVSSDSDDVPNPPKKGSQTDDTAVYSSLPPVSATPDRSVGHQAVPEVSRPIAASNGADPLTISPPPRTRSGGASRRSSQASRRFTSPSVDMPVPDAGDFQLDMRRSSIQVSGPHGQPSPISITGRTSRPSSVRGLDMSTTSNHSPKMNALNREQSHDHLHVGPSHLGQFEEHFGSPPDTAVGPSSAFLTLPAATTDILEDDIRTPSNEQNFDFPALPPTESDTEDDQQAPARRTLASSSVETAK